MCIDSTNNQTKNINNSKKSFNLYSKVVTFYYSRLIIQPKKMYNCIANLNSC